MPPFRCYLVQKTGETASGSVQNHSFGDLLPGEVTIQVQYSSLNYKDALAATGHPGVARYFPHVPGIDAAGVVIESHSPDFPVGTEVIATGMSWVSSAGEAGRNSCAARRSGWSAVRLV